MANPLAIGAAGLGAVGAFGSFFGKKDQAGEMRRQAREELRRDQAKNNATLGTARAAAGASGVEYTSTSLQDWLTTMDEEFTRAEQWGFRSKMKEASAMDSGALFGLIGDLGGTAMQYGAANNWFRPQQPPTSPSVPYYLARP